MKANHPAKNLPRTASLAEGARRKGAMARPTTVKTFPRNGSVAGWGETKKGKLKETRETKVRHLPQATIAAGERDKRRKLTRNEKVAQPTVPRGAEVPSRKRIAQRNQTTCITKKKRKNLPSCATVSVARVPWTPPGSELRRASAGRQKINSKKNLQSRASV